MIFWGYNSLFAFMLKALCFCAITFREGLLEYKFSKSIIPLFVLQVAKKIPILKIFQADTVCMDVAMRFKLSFNFLYTNCAFLQFLSTTQSNSNLFLVKAFDFKDVLGIDWAT